MSRFARYRFDTGVIELLASSDVTPKRVIGKQGVICAVDTSTGRVAVYDANTLTLSTFTTTVNITDCGEYLVGISGTSVYKLDKNGNILASYTVSTTPVRWAAYKPINKAVFALNAGVGIVDLATGVVTSLNVDPNHDYTWAYCHASGWCIVHTKTVAQQTWHGSSDYGTDYIIIKPDDTLSYIMHDGNLSVEFSADQYISQLIWVRNWRQNNARNNIELFDVNVGWPPITNSYYDGAQPSVIPNHCPVTDNLVIGTIDPNVSTVLARGDSASAFGTVNLTYSILDGGCIDIDATTSGCILLDENRNVRAVKINRVTPAIISDTIISTLNITPDVFNPIQG